MPEVILPCPECGDDCLIVAKNSPSGKWHTYCVCGHIGRFYPTRKKAIDAHNALPRMSTIIAWQFQAAGAALENQRLKAILQGILDNDGGEKGFNAFELDKFRHQARVAMENRHE